MALTVDEATRIVQFCLAGDGWGKALYEGDVRTINLVVHAAERTQMHEFEGETFEAALQAAVEAGVLKGAAVERQIAFVQRTSPRAGRLGRTDGTGAVPRSHGRAERAHPRDAARARCFVAVRGVGRAAVP